MKQTPGRARSGDGWIVGLDVGSSTVKAVAVDPRTDAIVWSDYRRHEARQHDMALDFLARIETACRGAQGGPLRVYVTGSGGALISDALGGRFVQEVNAVALAVERFHPDAQSVIELGGQDAKIIVYTTDPATGKRKKTPSMNDKCAGGTGSVIDRIAAKLGVPQHRLPLMRYTGVKRHPVAGKCGVFAETDVNSLQKQGVPADELMASLFESIVQQNLSVLTRGHTLRPVVLLLGGPNHFIRGLRECWREHIPRIWAERGVSIPADASVDELIRVPRHAHFFAALGAVEYGKREADNYSSQALFIGAHPLRHRLDALRKARRDTGALPGLVASDAEAAEFEARYAPAAWGPPALRAGQRVEAFVGVDAGSTSTKAVLIDADENVLAKAYRLSNGNPINDTREVLGSLVQQVECQGAQVCVRGAAVTGYAKDMLKDAIGADLALVETVAHAQSGLHDYPEADVICDVGGQDIKVIILNDGTVKDFKLNTQCSAGNGYYLQSTASALGYAVEDYAHAAFSARAMPEFSYGCAVFMQSDVVNFQRQGWRPHEILAGLAAVLPKNIWLYVCKMPNLARLGRTFILQGGTQRNMAAVKAQVDFINSRFHSASERPEIVVHRHCAVAGAIGCAMEVRRRFAGENAATSFIGFDAVENMSYHTTRDEDTRCRLCRNRCLRTFVDVEVLGATRRFIVAPCERGAAQNADAAREVTRKLDAVKAANPSLAETSMREAFKPVDVPMPSSQLKGRRQFFHAGRSRARYDEAMRRRTSLRIGMPRALNMYSLAPFFMGFFQSLGVPADDIVWSEPTSEELFKEGAKWGSIDPCYPCKLAIPHVHNLVYHRHAPGTPLTHIFFPMVESLPRRMSNTLAGRACPASTAAPEAVRAAFRREGDLLAEKGIVFKKTFLSLDRPALCAQQLLADWRDDLRLAEDETSHAVDAGLGALRAFTAARQREASVILRRVESERRVAIVLLGRPYHLDAGVNHGICEAIQKLGYPILTQNSLPTDAETLERLFGPEVAAGLLDDALSVDDVWKNSYCENSSRKLWAAKFVARHPNLAALELSSFKCGHDAPLYATVEEIVESAGAPFFHFRDIDENRPAGSIQVRVETIAYALERYQQRLEETGSGSRCEECPASAECAGGDTGAVA